MMPVFTGVFFASPRVQEMDAAEAGMYLLLLTYQWHAEGRGLPSDERSLRLLIRASPEQWAATREAVLPLFEDRDGRLFNARLEEHWQEAERRAEHARRVGKKGGRPPKGTRKEPEAKPTKKPGGDPTEEAIRHPSSVIRYPTSEPPPTAPPGGPATESEVERIWEAYAESVCDLERARGLGAIRARVAQDGLDPELLIRAARNAGAEIPADQERSHRQRAHRFFELANLETLLALGDEGYTPTRPARKARPKTSY